MKARVFRTRSVGVAHGCAVQGRSGVKPPRVREDQPAREPLSRAVASSRPSATGRSRTSTRSARSRRSATCRSRCTPGRSARSGTARPISAMQVEVLPTWELDSHDVLVLVMAAGVNYNGVWAALGTPISPLDVHKNPFHIAGSDASGIVWAVGSKVKRWKVGDEVVIHCNQDDGDDEECNGGDPMFSPSPAHLGLRDARRLVRAVLPRAGPPADGAAQASDLGGERLLHAGAGHRLPHAVRPPPAHPASRPERAGVGRVRRARLDGGAADRHVRRQRHRRGVRGRQARLRHELGRQAASSTARSSTAGARCRRSDTPEYDAWFKEARKFGKAIWEITGKGNNVDFVFEHPGEATFPVSVLVVKRGGMVVICAGTTGYNLTMDARYLWMHQKRVQGSHFANLLQAAQANKLVVERRIDPCMSEVFPWDADSQGAHAHVEERAQARQHGGARQRADHGPAHVRRRARGVEGQARVDAIPTGASRHIYL